MSWAPSPTTYMSFNPLNDKLYYHLMFSTQKSSWLYGYAAITMLKNSHSKQKNH